MKSKLYNEIKVLLNKLLGSNLIKFTDKITISNLPKNQAVYIIQYQKKILHVGRTYCAADGIKQRIKNHLYRNSSFMKSYNKMTKKKLKKYCSFKYIIVDDNRKRALLEFLTIGTLCPEYLGVYKGKKEKI